MRRSYEFHNFTIVEFYGDWAVYGTSASTMKYGFLGCFDTDKEAVFSADFKRDLAYRFNERLCS